MRVLKRSAIDRVPVARDEDVATEGLEWLQNHLAFGPGRWSRPLKFVATVQQQARVFAIGALALDRGLEARVAAHHLDFLVRTGEVVLMGFELRVRIGEMQQRHALALWRLNSACILRVERRRGNAGTRRRKANRSQ